MSEPLPADLDVDGVAAPPRRNGELAFDAPWQTRLFGLTMALCESGAIEWEVFRRRLIARIGEWDAAHPVPDGSSADGAGDDYAYWDHWQAAFVDVATEAGLVTAAGVDALAAELASRPAGHDHAH